MIPHINRIPQKPGRVLLTPVTGEANKYNLTRADEPLADGTPINKEMLDELLAASGVTTGSSVALLLAQEAYQLGDGYAVRFKIHTDITSADSPTLNINGTGGKRILSAGGYPFGSIKGGTWIFAIYDEVLDAYIISGTSDIVNLPVDDIASDDFVPFFDSSEEKSARILVSEFMKVAAQLINVKHEAARFTTSGTWTCPAGVRSIDAWLVGGGGAGGANGKGGGGGYCHMVRDIPVVPGQSYDIIIGAGGEGGLDGGSTSAFGYEVDGGKSGDNGGGGGNSGGSSSTTIGGDGGSRGFGGARDLGADWHTTNPYDGIDYAGGGGGHGATRGGNGGGSFAGGAANNGGYGGGKRGSVSADGGGGGGSYGGGGGGSTQSAINVGYADGGSGIVIIYAPVITEV